MDPAITADASIEKEKISSNHEDLKLGNAHHIAERGQAATDMYVEQALK